MNEKAGNVVSWLLWKVGTFFGGSIAVCLGLLYYNQEKLLYFPTIQGLPRKPADNPDNYRSPAEYGIRYEDIYVTEKDSNVRTHGWLMLQEGELAKKAPTILFFHGNAGNIGLRLPNAVKLFNKLKVNVCLMDYRGFGYSDDSPPCEEGIKKDAEACLELLLSSSETIDVNKIVLFGRSLGGAVAFHLAYYAQVHNKNLAGIIVENTFLSIGHMVDILMPFLKPIKPFMLRMDWGNHKIASRLKMPVLYLAGERDELVPHNQMKQLHRMSSSSSVHAEMHVVPAGTHNETWLRGGPAYWQKIADFLYHCLHVVDKWNHHNDDSNNDSLCRVQQEPSSSGSYVEIDTLQEEVVNTKSSDSTRKSGISNKSSTIPLAPKNLMGLVREATNSVHQQQSKKEE